MTFKPTKFAWIVFLAITIETLFSVPYLSWELATGKTGIGSACFALAAVAGITFLIWRWSQRWKNTFWLLIASTEKFSTGRWIGICFVVGVILRVLWVLVYHAPQRSDQATYLALARGLVENHRYGFVNGGLAYWPPGFPFFLAIWFFLLGFNSWVPLIANLALFGGTLVVVERLARRIGGSLSGRLATLLLVPWPTMVMIAGFAGKEPLVLFLLCLVLLTFSSALECPAVGGEVALAGVTGLLLGVMSLAQPSFLLFILVLVAYDYACKQDLLRAGMRAVTATVALCAVLFPWTLRNHRVLGAWIPISTNGGDVFYRANNSLASGGYTPRGEQDLEGLDEVARGKTGFRLGKEWIRAHPASFLSLGVRKQILFLGDDGQGAFETLKRGLAIGGVRYVLWKGVSNLYWWCIWMIIFLMIVVHWKTQLSANRLLFAAILSVVYLLAIHSVFESGGKYHEPLIGIIAVLAAQVVGAPASALESAPK